MENETCFTIPDGFLIIHREQTVDITTAEKWLCTKRQRKYTSALRVGDSAILKKDFIRCPYCGRETPAYVRFLSDSLKWIPWWQRQKVTTVSKSAIREWASPQYSLMYSTTLELNPIYFPVEGFTCPQCGAESEAGQVSLSVRIRRKKKQFSVSCGPLFLEELLALGKEIIVKKEELSLPFTESIVFNFSNGHVFFQITDANGALAAIYDITDFNREWAGTALHKILTSTTGQKKLYRTFRKYYGPDFPSSEERCTFNRLIALTKFQHYPREFYDAIPYNLGTGCMARGFKRISKKLLRSKNLPTLYTRSSLPEMKSVRRTLFTKPGLFFYLREAEAMWKVLDNPDYFVRLLKWDGIFEVLSYLQKYPKIYSFFSDLKKAKGASILCRSIMTDWYAMKEYAKLYIMMSSFMQARERRSWENESLHERFYTDDRGRSIPVLVKGDKEIGDCSVNGYSFLLLRTKMEYKRAGEALHNCLTNWEQFFASSVFAVKKEGRFKAAIEVAGGEIRQAHAAHNNCLQTAPGLYEAVEQWAKINGFRIETILE